jgi:hypothetical protein
MILVIAENLAPKREWIARGMGAAFLGRRAAAEARRAYSLTNIGVAALPLQARHRS